MSRKIQCILMYDLKQSGSVDTTIGQHHSRKMFEKKVLKCEIKFKIFIRFDLLINQYPRVLWIYGLLVFGL